jgi:hypothetical protein
VHSKARTKSGKSADEPAAPPAHRGPVLCIQAQTGILLTGKKGRLAMRMTRLALYIGVALGAFLCGVTVDRLLKSPAQPSPVIVVKTNPQPRPLTKERVSRALQSHSFRTDKLRTNSDDEIVWRWLKQSIADFPQNWVKLNISDRETYSVIRDPLAVPEHDAWIYYNRELELKGLPPLQQGKKYQHITVYRGTTVCPNWEGLIDVEEAKLVFFAGSSG